MLYYNIAKYNIYIDAITNYQKHKVEVRHLLEKKQTPSAHCFKIFLCDSRTSIHLDYNHFRQ